MTQHTHWDRILSFYHEKRRMPSYREIMELTGYKTKSAVHYFIDKCIDAGLVSKDASGRLIPNNIYGGAKVLGMVEAGFPSPAEEELADTMSLDEYLIENRDATYLLRVKGDSMIEAGICPGDMVIVERRDEFSDGQIVIAEVDGEWTVKYYRHRDGVQYLEPANAAYKPIYPENELRLVAAVTAVVRKY